MFAKQGENQPEFQSQRLTQLIKNDLPRGKYQSFLGSRNQKSGLNRTSILGKLNKKLSKKMSKIDRLLGSKNYKRKRKFTENEGSFDEDKAPTISKIRSVDNLKSFLNQKNSPKNSQILINNCFNHKKQGLVTTILNSNKYKIDKMKIKSNKKKINHRKLPSIAIIDLKKIKNDSSFRFSSFNQHQVNSARTKTLKNDEIDRGEESSSILSSDQVVIRSDKQNSFGMRNSVRPLKQGKLLQKILQLQKGKVHRCRVEKLKNRVKISSFTITKEDLDPSKEGEDKKRLNNTSIHHYRFPQGQEQQGIKEHIPLQKNIDNNKKGYFSFE